MKRQRKSRSLLSTSARFPRCEVPSLTISKAAKDMIPPGTSKIVNIGILGCGPIAGQHLDQRPLEQGGKDRE